MAFGLPPRGGKPSPRLKRRVLSGLVDENVRTIQNKPSGRLYRRPPVPWMLLGALGAVVLAAFALRLALEARAPAAPAAATPTAAGPPAEGASSPVPARIAPTVFPVSVRSVVLDPGHGGGDQGTRTPAGLTEKELTLDIARRTRDLLLGAGFQVALTRDDDERVSLRDRALVANDRRADLFVSIHVNWLEDGRANRGIETYFLGPSDDPFVTELAGVENQESGYAIADVRRLLDSIYADLRQEQSRALALSIQGRLVGAIREIAPAVRDRGVKSAPFLVLVSAEMPAVLAEVASASSAEEARLLAGEEHRQRIAVALSDGIRAYSDSVARKATLTEAR